MTSAGVRSESKHAENVLRDIPAAVGACLSDFFLEVNETIRSWAPQSLPLLDQVRELTLRGGKRLRPAFIVAAHHSSAAAQLTPALLALCGAVELLQTYLLIHDDWMDGGDIRRGGPSVHIQFGRQLGDRRLGEVAAVLAGDLASALAQEMVARAEADVRHPGSILCAFSRLQRQIFCGQFLDITGGNDLETLYDLKTGSYTVRGPLALGHALANGTAKAWSSLERYAKPLGVAFQMRDDLLDYADDFRAMSSAGRSDPADGRRTRLVALALECATEANCRQLQSILERTDPDSRAMTEILLREFGALEKIEERIAELRTEALTALEAAPIDPIGKQMLTTLAHAATERTV